MRSALTLFFVIMLVSILAACDIFPDNIVTINGTVTITLNGIPWNPDIIPSSHSTGPARNCPYIQAYTPFESGGGVRIGAAPADSYADRAKGTYKWSMDIPADKFPCLVYFSVRDPDRNGYPKRTDGIWVKNENTTIDLGIIDFKRLRLSGNLPVTINGEPLDYEDSQEAELAIYYPNIYLEEVSYIPISPNGDWSLNVLVPDASEPLEFHVWAEKKGCTFMQKLIPSEVISVHDTEHDVVKEVIFPSHPSIDFEAINISGTYKLLFNAPKTTLYSFNVYFEARPVDKSFAYRAKAEKRNPQPDDNGFIHWEIMLPVFSFPHDLPIMVSAYLADEKNYMAGKGNVTPNSIVIPITEDTDLNNIHLGTFTIE